MTMGEYLDALTLASVIVSTVVLHRTIKDGVSRIIAAYNDWER